ncbi:hypothetical protein Dsin_025298 [Dipteronia sinensis]|uniref:Uncharacterized protein n=1 Tax=Dipteronia sinensis TaxID=43782 RepID=A0AAD9ZX01_9ROSI|nr:hypothetical protein Dsin_025298 [Dipteronia sinensis]
MEINSFNLVVHGSVPGICIGDAVEWSRNYISYFREGRTPSARMTNQLDHGVVVWNPPEPVAEAVAIRQGLQLTRDSSIGLVVVESDAAVVVGVSDDDQSRNKSRAQVAQVQGLSRSSTENACIQAKHDGLERSWLEDCVVLEGYLQVPDDTTNKMAMVAGSSSSPTAAAAALLAHPHHPHQATTTTTKSWCDEECWKALSSSSSGFDMPTCQPDVDDMMLPFEDNCHTLRSNNFLP